MKNKGLIFVLFMFSIAACKKSSDSSAVTTTQPTKTYSVTYKFSSNNGGAYFNIIYSDASGRQDTLTSQSSGWQLTFTANAGTACSLSATSQITGTSEHVEIDYNSIVLAFGNDPGTGPYPAHAFCSGTLPD